MVASVASVAVERALSLQVPSSDWLRNSQLDELTCQECAKTFGGRMYFPITALCREIERQTSDRPGTPQITENRLSMHFLNLMSQELG